MKRKFLFSKEIFIFIHWLKKTRVILCSFRKLNSISLFPTVFFLFSEFTMNAQTDTVQFDDIEIISSRVPTVYSESARVILTIDKEDIKDLPVQSLQDLLEYFSGIDVRQRGNEGVQADIGINGGTFDQCLILINGFKMNDVQTGHHNMNLPIDLESIDRIEILEGPGNRVFGVNAYSGAVNIITDTDKPEQIVLSFKTGQYGYFNGNAAATIHQRHVSQYLSVSGKTSRGYLPKEPINNTDFNHLNLFYQTTLKTKLADFVVQAGFSDKSFGANSFYTPSYPLQYENTKILYAGYKTIRHGKYFNFLKSFYWRRHQDRFELFRESVYHRVGGYFIDGSDTAKYVQGVYSEWNYYKGHNYHKTNLITSELKYDIKTLIGKTAIGAEYNHAYIQSNVLGIEMEEPIDVFFEPYGNYTKEADRFNVNFYAEHVYSYKQLMIGGGISSNYNSDFYWNWSGGIDLSYDFDKRLKLFASVNQADRLPTYTDLYYDGPTNRGNPDLLPEHAITYESGLKYRANGLYIHINAFRRDGKNTIDWVRLNDTEEWQPQNITRLTTYGVGLTGFYVFDKNRFLNKISISYTWLDITKQRSDYISKYVLDYLKHKVVFSVQHKIYKTLTAGWSIRFEDRNGTYSAYDPILRNYTGEVAYKPYVLLDAKLKYDFKRFSFFTDLDNLLNTEYYDYGNIKMPGIWVKLGIEIDLKR
jgi:vitamin B12 transporter